MILFDPKGEAVKQYGTQVALLWEVGDLALSRHDAAGVVYARWCRLLLRRASDAERFDPVPAGLGQKYGGVL